MDADIVVRGRHYAHVRRPGGGRELLDAGRRRILGRRSRRPTVFVECTHTYHSDLNTGIQRVVRNILRAAPGVVEGHGYDLVPVILEGDRFVAADAGRVLADKQSEPLPARPSMVARIARRLRSHEVSGLEGSILLLLDSSWPIALWPAVARFKQRGGCVVGVIYDLIPITHAATYPDELLVSFSAWLRGHLRHSDGLVCISRSVADQLDGYIRSDPEQSARDIPIENFHLGSELDFVRPGETARPAVGAIFAGVARVFLMVGSIEPRKNHAFVLDAFEAFWRAGGQGVLVIAGRHAWKTEALLERIERHEEYGRQLFVLRDATDADLDHAYRGASALVLASEVEGFGLPIVEAFQYGLPVLCSDIPVFREIADGRATFFGLGDPGHLTAALHGFCRAATAPRAPHGWLTWRESAGQLFAAVLRVREGSTQARRERKLRDPN